MGEVQPATPISPERRRLVEAARGKWIHQLIDLSRRNTLLYFRHWKLASAELRNWNSAALSELLAGNAVSLVELLPADKEIAQRRTTDDDTTIYTEAGAEDGELTEEQIGILPKLKAISRKAQENFEERGMETLYIAYGMATWKATDGGRDPEAAVLLVPVRVEGMGRKTSLVPRGDLETNLALLYQLDQLGCGDLTGELQKALSDQEADESSGGVSAVFPLIEERAGHIDGFEIRNRLVIGNFSFEKLAMVKDLESHLEGLIQNDVVAALAGDAEAAASLRTQWREAQIDLRSLDEIPAAAEFLVAPADSSQQAALVMVGRGQSGVIAGPPGTGKSQTITNLIASLVAAGKSVLFVAQKRAALEVVQRRLERAGLAHLVLDLHGQAKKAEVMRSFADSYEIVRNSSAVDTSDLDTSFDERRKQLNDHVQRLHRKRLPSGLSVYELQAALLASPDSAHTDLRWGGAALSQLTGPVVRRLSGLLQEAGSHRKLLLREPGAPWAGARLRSEGDVSTALSSVAHLTKVGMPGLRRTAADFGSETHLPVTSLREVRTALALGTEARSLLSLYRTELFGLDLDGIATALSPATSPLKHALASMFGSKYRDACRQVFNCRTSPTSDRGMLQEVKRAVALRDQWVGSSGNGSRPMVPATLEALARAIADFDEKWVPLKPLLAWGDVEPSALSSLEKWLLSLERDRDDAYRIPRLCEIEQELADGGLDTLVSRLRSQRPPTELWGSILRFAYEQSCLEAAWLEDPQLPAFNGRHHETLIEEFRKLDAHRTQLAASRVRHAHARKAVSARDANPKQDAIVRAEAKKKKRHLTVRNLIAQAPDLVTALRPCWMASPLTVSQLLAGDARYFDVVIFDEASQVLPEDAVTSILRGRTVVVAGDEKQLPPTPFFASGIEEVGTSDEPDAVEGFESVLEIMGKIFDPWDLTWHYRSQDERLIAFSNHHIYSNRLITFPGVGLVKPVSFVQVHQEVGLDGQEESSSAEVRGVVDLILEHARGNPQESLGVIAMGIKHAYRIEAELARRQVENPELNDFFGGVLHPGERFFIKNLERVQGDERDAIILSMGYGKNRAGTLSLNFGPLTNGKMGHRRLNVAVTRAKKRVTAVASFTAGDMDPKRLNALGMKLTRDYLEYASAGGNILGDTGATPVPMNGFEESVSRALEAEGMQLIPQYGAGSYRLDFAVQHPERPGRFVMALECDGATYHSANTARDRDRLRQEHLELLGWTFCRVWSTDWYRDRGTEVSRIRAAYEAAVRAADEHDERASSEGSSLNVPPPPTMTILPPPERMPSVAIAQAPPVPTGLPIHQYSRTQLERLKARIEADGQLRTREELVREMSEQLGYDRLGSQIRARLEAIIAGTDRQPRPRVSKPAYRQTGRHPFRGR